MKCKCSLNNEHKVIGICDWNQFNEQIKPFMDNSYAQVSLPEQLCLPEKFPDLKAIIKTYLNINITSTKIVDTPTSDKESIEGLNLTGKMLLVYGDLYQTIIYSNDKSLKFKYSIKTKTPFSTYIIIDKNADKATDVFCVYPYVESVTLKPLNERSLYKSTTLFLFAHNISKPPVPPPPVIEKLPNAFVFRISASSTEMARVEFDKTNNELIVTSTSVVYGAGEESAFTFQLRNSSLTEIKGTGIIMTNENADSFKASLNQIQFEYGDLIYLNFLDHSKVSLTNYPTQDDIYNMKPAFTQGFKITENGIIPYILPNKIMLNNSANKSVVSIDFDILSNLFLVEALGYNSNPGGENYFKMTLYEDDAETIKVSSNIPGDTTGEDFQIAFFDEGFNYGNVIKLEYEDPKAVIITNFPDSSTPTYSPKGSKEWFQITRNGLIDFAPPEPPPPPPPPVIEKLPNAFVFNTNDTNLEMAKIEFDKTNKKLIVNSTGASYGTTPQNVFIFAVINPITTSTKILGTILGNGNADNFKTTLNGFEFKYGDLISLSFTNPNKVSLTNYPAQGMTYEMLSEGAQSFKITEDGIVPYILPNEIMLNDEDDDPVVTVQFDIFHEKILVESSGYSTNPDGGPDYFKMSLYEDEQKLKTSFSIGGDETGEDFKNNFSDAGFNYGYLIKLEYEENSQVVVTNFPTSSTPTYNPKGSEEWFKITEAGLTAYTPSPVTNLLPNDFIFNSFDTNEEIAMVEFDAMNKKLVVTSTGATYESSGSSVFNIEMRDSTLLKIKISSRIRGDRDASEFKAELDGFNFEFGDFAIVKVEDPSAFVLTDFPVKGKNYDMTESGLQAFEITEIGIMPYVLKNTILLNDTNGDPVLDIRFAIFNKKLLVGSTGKTTDPSGGATYFKFSLCYFDTRTRKLVEKFSKILAGGKDAADFTEGLTNRTFQFDDVVKLDYEDPTKILITNFPDSKTPIFTPSTTEQILQITRTGLIAFIAPPPPPIIVKLPNEIIVHSTKGPQMARIGFDITNKKLTTFSTDVIDTSKGPGTVLCSVTLKDITATLYFSSVPTTFTADLFNKPFSIGDTITISFYSFAGVFYDIITVTNYPNPGEVFRPTAPNTSVTFTILEKGLILGK